MKTLTKLVFAIVIATLSTAFAAQAEWVRGHFRSNGTYVAPYYRSIHGLSGGGCVYRNPYASYPSVRVRGFTRSNGTYVSPYVRTPPNGFPHDNLRYRGYGNIRVRYR